MIFHKENTKDWHKFEPEVKVVKQVDEISEDEDAEEKEESVHEHNERFDFEELSRIETGL